MTSPLFFKQFTVFNLSVVSLLLILKFATPLFSIHQILSWSSCIYFALLTLAFYLGGKYTYKHPDPGLFSGMFFIISGLKALGSIILIWIYVAKYKPEGQFYVLPFFLVYILYTIFEIHILSSFKK